MSAEIWTVPVRSGLDRPPSPHRRPGGPRPGSVASPSRLPGTGRNLYSIVHVDVVGSGTRDARGHRRLRDDLYAIMAEVTGENGIDFESLPFDDTGDGLRLIVPLDVMRPTRVVDAFVGGLAAELREHRRQSSELARIRMRACFDLGLVESHRRGWTGEVLVRAARLLDAPQVRDALVEAPDADLVVVVSEPVHEILRHRFSLIPPDCFQQIRVRVKEFDGTAWLLPPAASGTCLRCAFR